MKEKKFSSLQLISVIVATVLVTSLIRYSTGGQVSVESLVAAVGKLGQLERSALSAVKVECIGDKPKATLSWTPVPKATTYTISRNYPGSTGWPQIAKDIAVTSYTDVTFTPGPGLYSYQIRANGPGYRSSYSNVEEARIPSCVIAPPPPSTTPTSTPSTTPTPTPTPTPTSTPPTTPIPTPTPTPVPPQAKKEWGAYVGWREGDMATFESMVGKQVQYRAVFIHWGNENLFPFYLTSTVKDQGKNLIIFWEATDYNVATVDQPRFNYDSITSGSWDAYLKQFANEAKAYGGPVIIIPFSEMNGNWFPWSGTLNGNTPAKHIAAYRYIRNIFTNAGATNVKFGWAPNSNSVPDTTANRLEAYYPGTEYVDYVGVDGFNFGNPWVTFDQIFGNPLARLKVYNKPVFIFSFASAQGALKAGWITDALTAQIPKYPEIKGWIWFNELKERDWRVWSDTDSLAAFKAALP